MVDGVVTNLFYSQSFMYVDGVSCFVQNFFIVDKLAQKFSVTLWRYKITAWNDQSNKLNVMENKTYRFMQCELKAYTTSEKSYLGQAEFDVHLSPFS